MTSTISLKANRNLFNSNTFDVDIRCDKVLHYFRLSDKAFFFLTKSTSFLGIKIKIGFLNSSTSLQPSFVSIPCRTFKLCSSFSSYEHFLYSWGKKECFLDLHSFSDSLHVSEIISWTSKPELFAFEAFTLHIFPFFGTFFSTLCRVFAANWVLLLQLDFC